MEHKYILLIDMDGVICEWTGRVLSAYRERFPDRPCPSQDEVTQFYLEDLFPEEHRDDVLAIVREAGFYSSLEPIPGAIDALGNMMIECQGFLEPFICSSPEVNYAGLQCHSEKAVWVEKHLGPWWTKRLILTRDKTLVRGHILIDDKPEIKGVTTPTWHQLVFDQPYNRHVAKQRFTWSDWPILRQSMVGLSNETQSSTEEGRIIVPS